MNPPLLKYRRLMTLDNISIREQGDHLVFSFDNDEGQPFIGILYRHYGADHIAKLHKIQVNIPGCDLAVFGSRTSIQVFYDLPPKYK